MAMYLGSDRAGTDSVALQDFLPTPISFFRDSYAMEGIASILALVIVLLAFMGRTEKPGAASKAAKYAGLGLSLGLIALANWLVFRFKWQLSEHVGQAVMSKLSPLQQHSFDWHVYGNYANACYYLSIIGIVFFIFRRREALGLGVLQIIAAVKKIHENV